MKKMVNSYVRGLLCISMAASFSVGHSAYRQPYEVAQQLLAATTVDELCVQLSAVIQELVHLTTQDTDKKTVWYTALLKDYEQYELFLSQLMVHPVHKTIAYAPVRTMALKKEGYRPFIPWAKENGYEDITHFYQAYCTVLSYLICSFLHDIPLTSGGEQGALLMKIHTALRTLRKKFFHVKDSFFGQQFSHVVNDYARVVEEARKVIRQGGV